MLCSLAGCAAARESVAIDDSEKSAVQSGTEPAAAAQAPVDSATVRAAFEARLRKLRVTCNARAYLAGNLAVIVHALFAIGLLFYCMFLVPLAFTPAFGSGTYNVSFGFLAVVGLSVLLILTATVIARVFTLSSLFGYYYRRAYSEYASQDTGLLFIHEDYHRTLNAVIQRYQLVQVFKPMYKSLEQHLMFLAVFIFPLKRIAQGNRPPTRQMIGIATNTYQLQWIFTASTQTCVLVWLSGMIPLVGYFVLFVEFAILAVSSHYIISQAYLVAFLDWYLAEPRIYPRLFAPPAEPEGWWKRQTAPWGFREKHFVNPGRRYL